MCGCTYILSMIGLKKHYKLSVAEDFVNRQRKKMLSLAVQDGKQNKIIRVKGGFSAITKCQGILELSQQ